MGSWFSNISVKRNGTLRMEDVAKAVQRMMGERRYVPAASEEEADSAFAVVADGESRWFTIYSDLFLFGDPAFFAEMASPLSAALGTETLSVSCYDSDYLSLNLIDAAGKVDAWVGVGSTAGLGIKRRTSLAKWQGKVEDFPRFSECARRKYLFAEDILPEIAPCLGFSAPLIAACYEELGDMDLGEKASYLYFRSLDRVENHEPVRLSHLTIDSGHARIGVPQIVNVINEGAESRGLTVYFTGPYVEHEEITFSEVGFVKWKKDGHSVDFIPIELQKVRLPDGQYAYVYHDPALRLPSRVKGNFTPMQQLRADRGKEIILRYVPEGNPRKVLDITVTLVPDKNPEGLATWNAWKQYGSKAAFIADYNAFYQEHTLSQAYLEAFPPLREEDFD